MLYFQVGGERWEISPEQKAGIERALKEGKGITFKGYKHSWYNLMKAQIYEEHHIDDVIESYQPVVKERPSQEFYKKLAHELMVRAKQNKRSYKMSHINNARLAVGENPAAIFAYLDEMYHAA